MVSNHSSYFSVIVKKDRDALNNMFVQAYRDPHFVCAKVTYQEFYKEYNLKSRTLRAFTDPNQILFTGILKTIYWLTCALFYGLHEIFFKERRGFKACLYEAGRTAQEGVGHFISLFNGCLGAYLIEEAQLHRACYAYIQQPPRFAAQRAIAADPAPIARLTFEEFRKMLANENPDLTDKILERTLDEIGRLETEERSFITVQLLKLPPCNSNSVPSTLELTSKLTVAQLRMLSSQQLVSLKEPLRKSMNPAVVDPLYLALLTEMQIKALAEYTFKNDSLDFSEFREYSLDEQDKILHHYKETVDEIGKEKLLKWLKEADQETLNGFRLSELEQKAFPKSGLRIIFISDEQFEKMSVKDFWEYPQPTLDYIFNRIYSCWQARKLQPK